ncbi:FMN-binding negative transcriptional regulator [Neobacillus citreus]|uniref:FMN-binding negative transcriptional regulator n=1 Tax=Neobacillus citreus TaxID=2833578 RepID=A0A942T7P4_9BACI|nr:FMN-binding negative transcriptional regulator [Neobacillus citreus]MCH6268018.1 FMN-binding negative transcriptional regulator [Neobacillus citreus]
MYIPKHFKIEDEEIIYDFMENNSFATLVSQHNGEPYATHLPLTIHKKEGVLYGHFARPNGQWKDIASQKVLVIFQGPHCYISPSWYETNKAVPTWNYVAVHVYGQLEIVEDGQELLDALAEMVTTYEKPNSSYQLKDVDPGFIEGMTKGIVGFRINITKIEGKAKLSQNHTVERQELVIKQLESSTDQNDRLIAGLMRNNLKK